MPVTELRTTIRKVEEQPDEVREDVLV
jgi:hypothetical protein